MKVSARTPFNLLSIHSQTKPFAELLRFWRWGVSSPVPQEKDATARES